MKKKLTRLAAATVLAGSLGGGALALDSEPAGAAQGSLIVWAIACEWSGGEFVMGNTATGTAYCFMDGFVYEW